MSNVLSKEEMLKVAKLSKIKLAEDEIDVFNSEVSKVLDWFENLQLNHDVSDIKPMAGMGDKVELHTRPDEENCDSNTDDIFSNSPENMCDYFVVPKVIDNE